ncbi:cytochrome c biogenesis ATP-binding export protein CcmA [mine drainage metagenome]|uniref:Cytochrome c biogenesis ATP-binding export protein CcmA n=1 Tax=mine drainage metagenome TaxID=410659 RepID=A0A1J5TA96_9ZZZZ
MSDFAPNARFSGHGLACLRGERMVFASLDFALDAGGALLLLGPNGSGKSSLLRLLAGLLKPAAGRLAWNDQPVADDREAHSARVHYVGHHDAVKPVLTVWENLRFWAGLHSPAAGDALTAGALERFDLKRLAEVPGKLLSAGQKRRLNLARLLAAPAPVWLLDEPTVALDRASVKRLEADMARHRAEGGMVILSTHAEIDLPGAAELHLNRFTPAAPDMALLAGDGEDWL